MGLKEVSRNHYNVIVLYFIVDALLIISDSKSCLSGLNWPRSGKNTHFLALFWLVEGTVGIGWKWLVFGS